MAKVIRFGVQLITVAILVVSGSLAAAAEPGCEKAVKLARDALARVRAGQIDKSWETMNEVFFTIEREHVSKSCQEKRIVPIVKDFKAAHERFVETRGKRS